MVVATKWLTYVADNNIIVVIIVGHWADFCAATQRSRTLSIVITLHNNYKRWIYGKNGNYSIGITVISKPT